MTYTMKLESEDMALIAMVLHQFCDISLEIKQPPLTKDDVSCIHQATTLCQRFLTAIEDGEPKGETARAV